MPRYIYLQLQKLKTEVHCMLPTLDEGPDNRGPCLLHMTAAVAPCQGGANLSHISCFLFSLLSYYLTCAMQAPLAVSRLHLMHLICRPQAGTTQVYALPVHTSHG